VNVQIVYGRTTVQLADGRITTFEGQTTMVPVFNEAHQRLTIGGTTITLPDGRVAVVGAITTVLSTQNKASQTIIIGGTTTTLADGRVTVVGETTIVVPGPAATGQTIVIGGTSAMLADGRVVVVGGRTTVIPMVRTDTGRAFSTATGPSVQRLHEYASLSVVTKPGGGRKPEGTILGTSGSESRSMGVKVGIRLADLRTILWVGLGAWLY
jgi:hypothetical protein